MHKYILKRLIQMIPVLLGVTFIIALLMYVAPGCPARVALGDGAPEEALIAKRAELGVDRPFIVQYGDFLYQLVVHQDLGRSIRTNRVIITEIMDRFPTTAELAAASTLIAILIGIPVGIIAAVKPYSLFDNITMVLTLAMMAMPIFWMALLMILLFSVQLGWLPPLGWGSWEYMIMPAFAIGSGSAAGIARMTRSSMLEVIRQDYIRTARAKGQMERVIIVKHAFKNALIPIITIIGLMFGGLLGGAVLTEFIFSINGVGGFVMDGIRMREADIVQGGVLLMAFAFSIINLAVDVIYAFVDPRIKSQYR